MDPPSNNPAYVQSPSHLSDGASCNYVSTSLFGIPGVIPVAFTSPAMTAQEYRRLSPLHVIILLS